MLFIAIRQMMSRKTQTFFTLLGIVLGALAYVIISGFMLGLREYLVDQLINNDAQIKISSQVRIIKEKEITPILFSKKENPIWISVPAGRRDSSTIENPSYWIDKVKNDSDVKAFSPQLHVKSFFSRGKINEAGKIIGVLPLQHVNVVKIQDNMIQGNFLDIQQSGNKIILGEGLRELLGASLHDSISISTSGSKLVRFKIIGIFQMGNKAIDNSVGYVNLIDAQSFTNSPNKISEIAIRLKNVDLASKKVEEWKQEGNAQVQSWKQINSTFISLFSMQDAVRYAMVSTILVVAGFGIYNILNIVITQKRREIAILQSIGFEPNDILKIFLYQGLILGVIGGMMGMLLGFIISLQLTKVSFENPLMQTKSGMMNISFDPLIYMYAFLLAFIATMIASIVPAKSASNLSPIDIIRGE